MLSEIDATLCEKRTPYRDGFFVGYGHSLYETTFVPLVETRNVNDPIHRIRHFSPRSRASEKEKEKDKRNIGQKRHQDRVQTKVVCEEKPLKSDEKVNEREADTETKSERNLEETNMEEHQQMETTDLVSFDSKPKPSNLVESLESDQISHHTVSKLDQSVKRRDTTEKAKTADLESTQNDKTKENAASSHESNMCSPTQKSAISKNTSCDISRCPSIEEVKDEEFKDWKT